MFSCGMAVKKELVSQFIGTLSGSLQATALLNCLTFQFESASSGTHTNVFVEFAIEGESNSGIVDSLLHSVERAAAEVSADWLFTLQLQGTPIRDEDVVEAMEAANDSTEDFHISDLA